MGGSLTSGIGSGAPLASSDSAVRAWMGSAIHSLQSARVEPRESDDPFSQSVVHGGGQFAPTRASAKWAAAACSRDEVRRSKGMADLF